MIWILLNMMLSSWISMKRWNNFPRIEDISHIDNVWFILHIALFLSHLEEKEWNIVDKEFIIKRILFNSTKILFLSDISSWTRVYIEKINKDIFPELEEKVFNHILSFNAPKYIKEDIKTIMNDETKTLELSIIKAAKRYAAYKECLINMKVFELTYEVPHNEIMTSLEEKRKELKSLDRLLKDSNYEKYLLNIRKLSHSFRWNSEKRIFPISVMSHLVITAFLSYIIWSIENAKWWKLNIYEMMLKAIYHDIPEAMTWDIITPTKKAIPWFSEILEEVEKKMLKDYLFYYVWDEYENFVKDYMLNPWAWTEWKYVKYADVICAMFESKIEVNYWSTNYIEIYRSLKRKVNAFEWPSVEYMLKEVSDSFDDKNINLHFNNW